MSNRGVGRFLALSGALLALPVFGLRAGPPLAELVPDDVIFFASGENTPEQQRLMEPYSKAFHELVKSGIGRDIFDLATMDLSESDRDQARAIVRRVIGLLRTPAWGRLVEREMAVAFRFAPGLPLPEYVLLFRIPAETADERRGEFHRMLSGFAEMAPDALQVSEAEEKGAKMVRFQPLGAPIGLSVATRDDVLVLSTSVTLVDSVLDLLASETREGSIAKQPRFQKAMESLQGPSSSLAFFDIKGYFQLIRGMLGFAAGAAQGDPSAKAAVEVASVVLEELGRLGTVASKGRTDDRTSIADSKLTFAEGPEGFIEKIIGGQEEVKGFPGVVPRDAISVYMTSGLDPSAVYDGILELVRKHVPDGEKILEKWKAIQGHVGFNLREDLLSWLAGGWGWVALPPRAGCPLPETVVYFKLRSPETAREKLETVWRTVRQYLASCGQDATLSPIPGLDDFHELNVPSLPWLHPVFAVAGDTFVIASSPAVVEKVASTFRGESPNFGSSPAYSAMQFPEGRVVEVWYADIKGSLRGLSGIVGTAGFVASILPENRDTRHARKLGAILTKLSVFLQAIDLGTFTAGWTRQATGERAMYTRSVGRIEAAPPSR